jgi:hypothetical protein
MKFLLDSSNREQSIAIANYLGPAARTLDFIEGPLSSASYSQMIGQCDVILLPYDPEYTACAHQESLLNLSLRRDRL